jgi:hypothetical protein
LTDRAVPALRGPASRGRALPRRATPGLATSAVAREGIAPGAASRATSWNFAAEPSWGNHSMGKDMHERLLISVSFDPLKGYVATGSTLPAPISALSLNILRKRIEIALLPETVEIKLELDRRARQERDRRRAKVSAPSAARARVCR